MLLTYMSALFSNFATAGWLTFSTREFFLRALARLAELGKRHLGLEDNDALWDPPLVLLGEVLGATGKSRGH